MTLKTAPRHRDGRFAVSQKDEPIGKLQRLDIDQCIAAIAARSNLLSQRLIVGVPELANISVPILLPSWLPNPLQSPKREAKMRKPKPARERAARALCDLDDIPPDVTMDGEPMWVSYLPEVDAVLQAALCTEDWNRLMAAEQQT